MNFRIINGKILVYKKINTNFLELFQILIFLIKYGKTINKYSRTIFKET